MKMFKKKIDRLIKINNKKKINKLFNNKKNKYNNHNNN